MFDNPFFYLGILILFIFLYAVFQLLREYERGVFFFLGRYQGIKGPGLIFIVPFIQQIVKVDLRTVVMDIPSQDVISRDNVLIKVSAVIYARVIEPDKAVIQVEDYRQATSQLAQTTLRSVLGRHELDDILAQRDQLNVEIQQLLDKQTDVWGVKMAKVEIKHIELDESMIRSMTQQAEAERERRAKIIHADGELQASDKLVQAANALVKQPQALQLRYLQTMTEIADKDKSHTVIFPLPLDLLLPLQRKLIQSVASSSSTPKPTTTSKDSKEPTAPTTPKTTSLEIPQPAPVKSNYSAEKKKRKFPVYAGFR